MNNRRAHEVLKEMTTGGENEKFTGEILDICELSAMFNARAMAVKATLEGDFTADQLEAIAAWMRDPKGVVECDARKSCGAPEDYNCKGIKCKDCDFV